MSGKELGLVRTFVATRRWQFATVRSWCPEDETAFEEFVRLLREYGDDEVFEGRPYRYLDFEGHHYWSMGAPIAETTVINRKPLAPE